MLHGAWIDVGDEDAVWAEIRAMLKASPEPMAEEFAIHDHDGFGGVGDRRNNASIGKVVRIADFLRARERLGALVLEQLDGDLDSAAIALEDQYCGVFGSLADYFQDLTEETTQVPEHLRLYIDYGSPWPTMRGRAARCSTVETAHDQMHVFRTR
ncbi:antirestriction protein ArdA [Caulobacter segnis]